MQSWQWPWTNCFTTGEVFLASGPWLIHFCCFLTHIWRSPTGFPSQSCITLGKNFRQGGVCQCSQGAVWCDVPLRWCSLCYTGKSTIAFNFIFLALITWSTPSSPPGVWGISSQHFLLGEKRVLLRKFPALTAGHSVALKFVCLLRSQCCFKVYFSALVLPCWLPISFWL